MAFAASSRISHSQTSSADSRNFVPKGKEREKGLWTFLTWSFFLSQVVASEQAQSAHAQPPGDEAGPSTTDPAAAASELPSAVRDDADPNETGQAQSHATGQATAKALPFAGFADAPIEFTIAVETGPADQGPGVGQTAAAMPAGTDNAAVFDPLVGGIGDVAQTLEPVLDGMIAPVVGLAGDVVGDLVQALDPVLDGIVAPVVGLAGDVVGNVVDTLDPIVDGIVAPVMELAGDVVGDLVQTLDPVLDGIVAPVLGLAGDLVGDVVHTLDPVVGIVTPVVGLAGDVVGNVVHTLDPVLDGVAVPIADVLSNPLNLLLDLESAGGQILTTPVDASAPAAALASSGIIAFTAISASLEANELFQDGRYTDYGLSLHGYSSLAGNGSSGSSLLHQVASVADDLAGAIVSSQPAAEHTHASGSGLHHGGLTGALADIGLHGLGL